MLSVQVLPMKALSVQVMKEALLIAQTLLGECRECKGGANGEREGEGLVLAREESTVAI